MGGYDQRAGYTTQQTSDGLWGSAGLKMPIHAHSFRQAILTRKVGQTDLVFSTRSVFIVVGLYVQDYWLQVSVCSSSDLFHPG